MNKLKFLSAGAFAIASLAAGHAMADTNLVVNGGFETGNFTGWTATGSYPQSIETLPAVLGTYTAQIAGYSVAPDNLSQTIATVAGQSYLVSFWREQVLMGETVSLNATWNGTSFFSELNPTNGTWQQFTALVVGTGSDTLNFASANDVATTFLDNVSVTAVPDPATWALMLVGLSGLGVLRGVRKPSVVVA